MKIVKDRISIVELREMSKKMRDDLVKAMVDVEKSIMAVDAGLHADLHQLLIDEENSQPKDLWGINMFPEKTGADFIQFDSMMNLKPALGNRTRGVSDPVVREKIVEIVKKLVTL